MIPIHSLGGASLAALTTTVATVATAATVATILVALTPAIVTWWTDRRLIARRDDPALPELIANRRRTSVSVGATAAAIILVLSGARVAWGIPLLIVAVTAAGYPFRTRLLGETWSFWRYLWHAGLSLLGGFGFWIALVYAPFVVQSVIGSAGEDRLAWAAAAAACAAAVLFAWEAWYGRLWLWAHAARPLVDAVLTPRFDEIVRRAGTRPPDVYRVGPQGSRFVNAVALPSTPRSAVAMGDALLELLDADETTAIFAHEVAHFDHFTPRYIRRAQFINRALIIVGVAMPLVAAQRGGWPGWLGWVWPVIVVVALLQRATRSQQRETDSDLRAAELCGDPEALVRGLVKLHVDARIPRRYAVDTERAATHPSLVRRIQAIRGSAGVSPSVEQLGGPTVVESTRVGTWVVINDVRTYWLDGVPPGTHAEPAALRDAASSYRAVNYADMVELRVAAAGDARSIRARTRAGDAWSVPISRDDVVHVQRALDVVDVRLARVGPGTSAGTPRFMAIVAAAIAIIAGQLGVVLVPIALALWKGGPAAVAALGAMSIVRAMLGAFEATTWLDKVAVGIGLVALGAVGVASLVVARRMARASDAPAHFRLTMSVLLGAVAVIAAALTWDVVRTNGRLVVGAPLMGTLATVVAGAAAALLTARARWGRPTAFATLAAAAALATISIDRKAWALRRALTKTSATAIADGQTDIGTMAHQLRVSPAGTHFMVSRISANRPSSTVVLLGRIGGSTRELAAVAGEFIDSTHVLLLDELADGGRLRLEHVDSIGQATWADTIPQIDVGEPRLMIDRDSNSWVVMATDPIDDKLVVVAGTIGQRGVVRRVVMPDTVPIVGEPIVFGAAATVMIPSYGLGAYDNFSFASVAPVAFRALFGGNELQSEIRRVVDGKLVSVAPVRGYPECGEPLRGIVACAARQRKGTSLYTLDASGVLTEVARPAGQELGVMSVGPGLRVASLKLDRSIADIDLATRHLTRIVMPANADYAAEVRTGPGYVITLSHGDRRQTTVRRYRVQ